MTFRETVQALEKLGLGEEYRNDPVFRLAVHTTPHGAPIQEVLAAAAKALSQSRRDMIEQARKTLERAPAPIVIVREGES